MSTEPFPVIILTLPGDEARRAPLTSWLKARGIAYELFFGVDGRQGLPDQWEGQVDRKAAAERLGRAMGDGEFACALSHQEIYREVLERDLQGAVVLEDDAVPGEGMADFLKAQVYLAASMMLLDHANTRVVRGGSVALPGGMVGHRVAVPPFYANAYSLDSAAAAFLRAHSFPISYVADWPCDISRIGALAVVPRPVGHKAQGKGPSHLDKERRERQRRGARFASPAYWVRWWVKRRAVRLPDANDGAER